MTPLRFTSSSFGIVLLSLPLFTACATPKPPRELVDARTSYSEAAQEPTARVNPAGVDTARQKLAEAERVFLDEPESQQAKDRAYIADRAARLAIAQGETKSAALKIADAQKQLGTVAKSTANQLQKTKEELALSRQKGQMTQAELEKERNALTTERQALEAERQKGSLTAQQLAEKETELVRKEAELEAEKTARLEAEKKAKAALDNLAKMAAVKEDTRGTVITLSGQVLFASGKSMLLPAAQAALDNVVEVLMANPDRNIVIEGHTDSMGQKAFNQTLSQERADSVRTYLVQKGVPPEIITAKGLGQDQPIADNKSADGRANNRRVEIIVSPAERK